MYFVRTNDWNSHAVLPTVEIFIKSQSFGLSDLNQVQTTHLYQLMKVNQTPEKVGQTEAV